MAGPERIERLLNRCPVLDCDDLIRFPLASEKELVWMVKQAILGNVGLHVFPFVRFIEGQAPFVEIYFWDQQLYERDYVRFVICEGMCLS